MQRLLLLAVLVGIPIIPILGMSGRSEPLTMLLFVLIIMQSAAGMLYVGGLLFKVYSTFSYFFFGVAPFLEFRRWIVYWGGSQFADETYLFVNLLVLGLNALFFMAYVVCRGRLGPSTPRPAPAPFARFGTARFLLALATTLLCLLGALYLNNFSLLSLLLRGGEFKETAETSAQLSLTLMTFFRGIAAFTCAFYWASPRSRLLGRVVLLAVAALVCSPSGMPRFMVAALYTPLLLTVFPSLRRGSKYPVLLIAGLLIAAPLLDNFRRYGTDSGDFLYVAGLEYLLGGHFDSYQSIARAVQTNFISYGHQLLGPLLFFLPRAAWPDKPIGTGAAIAADSNLEFSNISANWYAEGYANFGVLGAVLFCVLLAWACARLDKRYRQVQGAPIAPFHLAYFGAAGFLFFLLRGDLLSATSYGVAIALSFALVDRLLGPGRRSKLRAASLTLPELA